MYQVTAPLSARQLTLIQEFKRLEAHTARTGIITGLQGRRRAAIVSELHQIESEKLGVAA